MLAMRLPARHACCSMAINPSVTSMVLAMGEGGIQQLDIGAADQVPTLLAVQGMQRRSVADYAAILRNSGGRK